MSLRQAQQDVRKFHLATGGTVGDTIAIRDAWLRANLIAEEAAETISALGIQGFFEIQHPDAEYPDERWVAHPMAGRRDLAKAIDGLCDLIYVTLGTAVAMGVPLSPYWDLVQQANMAKAAGPKREDGKQLKPEGWQPPDIEGLLQQMQWSELFESPPWPRQYDAWEALQP